MTLPPCECGAALVYSGHGAYPRRCEACRRERHRVGTEKARQARVARDPELFRRQARISKRRQSARHYAQERAHRVFCPWRMGPHYVCMGRLETVVLPGGGTTTRCPKCMRREAGICQTCNNPVEGRTLSAMYCAGCRQAAALRHAHRYRIEHVKEIVKRQKAKRRANPEPNRIYSRQYRRRRKQRALRGTLAPRRAA